uniref:3-oxoacyl-(Acyl-carrier-protein) reductase 3, chloroplastic n=1 Tax=Aegilops tauschii TaxID=37682 RepID=M8C5Y8_AEGTA
MASSRPETAGGAPWSKLQGQVVLVTGASSGLGREFCLDLARAGCRVVGAARRADRLRSLCDEINAAAQVPLAVAVGLDVAAGESSVEAAVLTAWDAFGRVDVLINNAGVRAENSLGAILFCRWVDASLPPYLYNYPQTYRSIVRFLRRQNKHVLRNSWYTSILRYTSARRFLLKTVELM